MPHKLNMSHHVHSMSFGEAPRRRSCGYCREVELGYNGLASTDHHALGSNTRSSTTLVIHWYEVARGKTIETFQYTVNNNHYQDGDSLPSAVSRTTSRRCRSSCARSARPSPPSSADLRHHRRRLHGDRPFDGAVFHARRR